MKTSRSIFFGLAFVGLATPAFADCQRTGSLICGSGAPHIVSDAPVQASRGAGFTAISASSTLKTGDRVLIGSKTATLSLGPSCQADIGANSLVTIRGDGTATCVSVTEQASKFTGVVEKDDDKRDLLLIGGAVAGSIALAVGLAVANSSTNAPATVSSR